MDLCPFNFYDPRRIGGWDEERWDATYAQLLQTCVAAVPKTERPSDSLAGSSPVPAVPRSIPARCPLVRGLLILGTHNVPPALSNYPPPPSLPKIHPGRARPFPLEAKRWLRFSLPIPVWLGIVIPAGL